MICSLEDQWESARWVDVREGEQGRGAEGE